MQVISPTRKSNKMVGEGKIIEQLLVELDEIRRKVADLEEAKGRLVILGHFSGTICHEIRNPLNIIGSSAYYLKNKLEDADEKVHQHLDRIKANVDMVNETVQSMLNLTRMNRPQLVRFNLIDAITETIAAAKIPRTVTIRQEFPEAETFVEADRKQLGIAFQNIITNAVEAMHNKGKLTITVRCRAADGQAEISFADTGPGIARDNLERVFQPLFSTKSKGIGFGLYIARIITEKHHGTIAAKTSPSEGATITIKLPLDTSASEEE